MVAAAALPVTKIVALLIKTLAKPLSKRIKHEFNKNNTTQYSLIIIGQYTHQFTSRLTIWSAGYRVNTIHPLSIDDALKQGSEVLGESIILSISIGALIWEYNKSKDKERKKELLLHEIATMERNEIIQSIEQLQQRILLLENNNNAIRIQKQHDKNEKTITKTKSFFQYIFG